MGAAGGITGMKSCGLKGWLRDDADGRRVGGASRRGGGGLGDRARKEMKGVHFPPGKEAEKPFPAKFLLLRKSVCMCLARGFREILSEPFAGHHLKTSGHKKRVSALTQPLLTLNLIL